MKQNAPNMPSPEDIPKMEAERTQSDAELLKGGAEYTFNEKGEKVLIVTDEQIEKAKSEMGSKEVLDDTQNVVDYTLEERAHIEKERTISDSELIQGGAEYKLDEKGEKTLEVTEEQIEEKRNEMFDDPSAEVYRTKRGIINGQLVDHEGEYAIFDTPEGKLRVHSDDLISPEGKK